MAPSAVIGGIALAAYALATVFLATQGLHSLWLLLRFLRADRRRRRERSRSLPRTAGPGADQPPVLVQLPVYHERDVVGRLVAAAGALDWPSDRLRIQLLDDGSGVGSDDSVALGAAAIAALRQRGIEAVHVRRPERSGFKAGALAHGLAVDAAHPGGAAPFVAIFDADFVPGRDFLQRALPTLAADAGVAFVQGRWEHLNPTASLLTRAQAIGIDGHFAIEQGARAWSGLSLNFNGTCGVWRRQAIEDSGGWQHDTLTEDLDLSYRAQLRGWRAAYDLELAVPGELPPTLEAWRAQQFRWAKGSLQTARKLLPAVWRSDWPRSRKLGATMHLTHYLVHPAMVASMVLAPIATLVLRHVPALAAVLGTLLLLAGLVPPLLLYAVAQWRLQRPLRRLLALPALMSFGTGIALANTRAAWQALRGRTSEFVRTPKHGSGRGSYRAAPAHGLGELGLGALGLLGLIGIWNSGTPWLAPIVLLYVLGFLGQGLHLLLRRVAEAMPAGGGRGGGLPLPMASATAVAALAALGAACRTETWMSAPRLFAGCGLAVAGACAIAAWVGRTRAATRTDLLVVVVTAVVLHTLALALPLGDDARRYAVEGAQLLAGENPFSIAPAATQAIGLDTLGGAVNHPTMTSIYPPVMLAAHAYVMQTLGGVHGFRWLALFATVATSAVLLVQLLRQRRSPVLLAIVLWHPVVVLFGTGEGHHDALAALGLVLAFVALDAGRGRTAVALVALAALSKPFAIAALPVVLAATSWRHLWLPIALATAAYLPFATAGRGLVASLLAFGGDMQFHGALEPLLRTTTAALGWPLGPLAVRAVLATCLGGGLIWLLRRSSHELPASRAARALGLLLLCLPTLHPWYFTTLVVLLPFTQSRALLGWTLAAPCYWLHGIAIGADGTWANWPPATALAHLPFVGWMLLESFGPLRVRELPATPELRHA